MSGIKKNILIATDLLRPGGGPAGYLFNLRLGLERICTDNLNFNYFVKQESTERVYSLNRIGFKSKFLNLLSLGPIADLRYLVGTSKRLNMDKNIIKKFMKIYGNQYEIINFHSPFLFYSYLKINNNLRYNHKKVYMQHSPIPFSHEMSDEIESRHKLGTFFLYKRFLTAIENIVFSSADYLLLPTKYSLEGYYRYNPIMEELLDNKKMLYLYTGIKEPRVEIDRKSFRRIYSISEDAFLIGFIGRYNFDKGFDIFKETAKFSVGKDIIFISAGIEINVKPPKLQNYINIGWTKFPYDLINACDIIMIPNRYTYFDILALECLALGKPILVSYTGGNKELVKLSSGIIPNYSNTPREYVNLIEKIKSMTKSDLIGLSLLNRKVYENNFTLEQFAESYKEIMKHILAD